MLSSAEFNATHVVQQLPGLTPPRESVMHAPQGWNGRSPLPVLVMIHGGGGTPRTAAFATGASRAADERGFLVVYPAALPRDPRQPVSFLRNPTFWNVGSGFGHAERLRIDDTAYIGAVLDDVERRYAIDRDRIYVAGFSNGAALALRVAVDLSERIRAVTAIAGHLWRHDRRPARPVPLLYMIGTADPIVPPAGGVVQGPWGSEYALPPVRETIELWAAWNGCAAAGRVSSPAAGVTLEEFGSADILPASNFSMSGRNARPTDAVVRFVTIEGAGHVWPGGPSVLNEKISGPATDRVDATAMMLEFFGL